MAVANPQYVQGDNVFVRVSGLWMKGRYSEFANGKHNVRVGRQAFSVNGVDLAPNKKPLSEKDKAKARAAKVASQPKPDTDDNRYDD